MSRYIVVDTKSQAEMKQVRDAGKAIGIATHSATDGWVESWDVILIDIEFHSMTWARGSAYVHNPEHVTISVEQALEALA